MNQTLFGGVVERVRSLQHNFSCALLREFSTAGDQVLHRAAVHELHRKKIRAEVFAGIMDLDDIGMIQFSCGADLAQETLDKSAVAGELRRKDFERDLASQRKLH